MISQSEQKYIKSIPEDKVVQIDLLDEKAVQVAEKIISKVKNKTTDLKVVHMGALALGISGK